MPQGDPTRRDRRAPARRRGPAPWRLAVVAAVCAASAAGVLAASGRPTGNNLADPVWEVLLGVAVPLAASRARRWSLLVLATVTALAADSTREVAVAMGALLGAVGMAVLDRRDRIAGALIGAATIQVLVRLPDLGFHGASAVVTAVAVLPVLASGLRNTRRRWRRPIVLGGVVLGAAMVLLVVLVAGAALLARGKVDSGIDAARAGLDAVAAGDDEAALEHLRRAESDLDRAATLVDNPLARLARGIPVVAQHQRALGVGTRSAHDLAAAAADAATVAELEGLRPVDGGVDLDAVRSIADPLERAVDSLESARTDLSRLGSPWVVAPVSDQIDELAVEVDDALPSARTALAGARVAPGMLGGDGPRRWLVLFMTPAESRLLGGFVGNWALVDADDGQLRLVSSGSASDVNDGPGAATRTITEPAEFVERYVRYTPDAYFQNTGASPHFPSSAQVAASFFEQSMGEEVDGVIAIDPSALGGLVDVLGGIDGLPGVEGPLDGEAVERLLLYDVYERSEGEQDEIYAAAIEGTFAALTSRSLPGPSGLADTMSPFVRQGRFLVWSEDPAEQELLDLLGVDGALPPADGRDIVLVGIANNSPNKIDSYLERDITYAARYEPTGGGTVAEAEVTFTNTAPLDLRSEVIGNAHDLPPGTARTYVTLFSPLVLEEVRVDGTVVPVAAQSEQGLHTYSVLVDIPPQGQLTVTWALVGTLAPGGYHLDLRAQPLARPATAAVTVTTSGVPWASPDEGELPAGVVVEGTGARFEGPLDAPTTWRLDPAR